MTADFERPGCMDTERLRSVWASYAGHFRHANSYRLTQRLKERFPWLP
jgi:RNA-directed DNA polymerase